MLPTTNQNLYNALSEYVYGHDEAKKAVITLLSRSNLRFYQKYINYVDNEYLVSPLKLLLVGGSGTGKTHIVETARNISYFPFVKLDATHLTPTGAKGGINPEEFEKRLLEEAKDAADAFPNRYLTIQMALDNMVVFVDEVDKLGASWESSGNWNKHVQSNFLTMFDGKSIYSGVSFIFAGAFSDMKRKTTKNSLGFVEDKKEKHVLIDDDIIAFGLIPELVGRINYIVELDKFTKEDLYKILTETILVKKRRDLAAYGIINVLTEEKQLEQIVIDAMKSGQGVRHMQRAVEKLFLEIEFDADFDRSFSFYLGE